MMNHRLKLERWLLLSGTLVLALTATTSQAQSVKERTTVGAMQKITSIVFSPENKTFASAGIDDTVKIWDRETARAIHTLENKPPKGRHGQFSGVVRLAYSPDGKLLAANTSGTAVRIWDAATGKSVAILEGHEQVPYYLAFSPDSKALASSAGADGTVKVWDPATGKITATVVIIPPRPIPRGRPKLPPREHITSIVFAPDGKTLAVSIHRSRTSAIELWDIATGLKRRSFEQAAPAPRCDTFSPDGNILAAALWSISLWDASTGKHKGAMKRDQHGVQGARFSPDGKTLTTFGIGLEPVIDWDVATLVPKSFYKGAPFGTKILAMSLDRKTIAGATHNNNSITLYDVLHDQ